MGEMTLTVPTEYIDQFVVSARTIGAHIGESLKEALTIGYREEVLDDAEKRAGWCAQENQMRRLLPHLEGLLVSIESVGSGDLEIESDRELVAMVLTDCLMDSSHKVPQAAESANDGDGHTLQEAIEGVEFWRSTRESAVAGTVA